MWKVDNAAVQVAILNQASNRSQELCKLAMETLLLAESLNVSIEPVWFTTEENILADGASHCVAIADW